MPNLKFPVFIDLEDKTILVIGGGKIALRRIKALLMFGASVSVVAPEMLEELKLLAAENSKLSLKLRTYEEQDLEGKFMVLCATDDAELNHSITVAAKAKGLLANNASKQEDNNFFFPAVAKNETISVGICGTGEDHARVKNAASKIRSLVEE